MKRYKPIVPKPKVSNSTDITSSEPKDSNSKQTHALFNKALYTYRFVDNVTNGKAHRLRGSTFVHPKHKGYLKSTILPSNVSLKSKVGSVLNQGAIGACVAHSSVQGIYIVMSNRYESASMVKRFLGYNGSAYYSSRLYIYCNAREWDGTDIEDDVGCTNLSACLSLSKYKACEEEYWPYVENKYSEQPPKEAYDRAARISNFKYSVVEQNLHSIKSAIASNHPVMFGLVVYPSFVNCGLDGGSGNWEGPNQSESPIGGHSLLLVGYDDESHKFSFVNHWGPSWGSGGFGYIDYRIILDNAYVGDLCAIESFN